MRVLISILTLLLLMPFPGRADAQAVPISVLKSKIEAAAKESASTQRLLLDPRFIDAMVANALLYTENFCPSLPQDCEEIFGDGGTLFFHVSSYLTDVVALSTSEIYSLAGRLSKGELERAGWPSMEKGNAGLLKLPVSIQASELRLRYATSEVLIGSGAVAILMIPGSGELIVVDNAQRRRLPFAVERSKSSELLLTPSHSTGAGGDLQAAWSHYCYQAPPVPISGPFAMFNDGRARIVESQDKRMANLAPFATQFSVHIGVGVDATIQCDRKCQAAMASLFAEAIATWRSGCNRCDPNALVIIHTMGTTWIDRRLVRRLRLMNSQPSTSLNLSDKVPGEVNQTIVPPAGAFGPGVNSYVNVAADKDIPLSLCKLNDSKAPWVRVGKSYICPNQNEIRDEKLRPSVVLKNGETACGEIAVACGLPSERVEVNVGLYKYSIPSNSGDGDIIIGADDSPSLLEMRTVILHEVGHWFGVPHAEEGKNDMFLDLMSERYNFEQPCVSAHSLRMLANASDLRWGYRIKRGGALLPPLSEE